MHDASAASVFTPISYSSDNNVGERTMYEFTSKNKQLVSIGTMPVVSSSAA